MEKPTLFLSRALFDDVHSRLAEEFEVEIWDRYQAPPYDVIVAKAKEADALVTLLSDKVDCGVLSGARARIIAQYAVGFDNVDLSCATNRGIYVTNTPDVLTEATAEFTWALIMSVARRVVEGDHFVRYGEWQRTSTSWHPTMLIGMELKGKVLGVVGLGRIGRRVAEIGKGFGMRVIYWSRSKHEEAERSGINYASLNYLLMTSDVISLNLPLNKETWHIINSEALKLMKRSAILVNTGRGALIDTDALVQALRDGMIAGVGLDVYEQEPLPQNHPLTAFKNAVLAPHAASATYESRHGMAELVVENLLAFKEGRIPPTLVNREVAEIRAPGFSRDNLNPMQLSKGITKAAV
ncbi:glyoxylate reductase [Tardisphaera saccharovorans]